MTKKHQPLITDKIKEQIFIIRSEGNYNMFDITAVQREAYNKEFYELTIFLEEYKKEYTNFILTGQR